MCLVRLPLEVAHAPDLGSAVSLIGIAVLVEVCPMDVEVSDGMLAIEATAAGVFATVLVAAETIFGNVEVAGHALQMHRNRFYTPQIGNTTRFYKAPQFQKLDLKQ